MTLGNRIQYFTINRTPSKWEPASMASFLLLFYLVFRIVMDFVAYQQYQSLFENTLVPQAYKDVLSEHLNTRLVVLFLGLLFVSGLRFIGEKRYAVFAGILVLITLFILKNLHLTTLAA